MGVVGEPTEGEGQPERPRVARDGRREAGDVGDPAQPVAHGVGVHEQLAGGALERPGALEVRRERLDQRRVLGEQAQVDVVDEPADRRRRRRRARARAAGRTRAPGAGRPARPRRRGSRRATPASCAARPTRRGTSGPTTTGPGAKWATTAARRPLGSVTLPSTTTSRCACTPVSASRRWWRAERFTASATVSGSPSGACPVTTQTPVTCAPAERGAARDDVVVDVVAQQGVEHERLEPGVPRAARLGGAGVDLGGGEGDLAGVEQHAPRAATALSSGRRRARRRAPRRPRSWCGRGRRSAAARPRGRARAARCRTRRR